MRNDLIGGRLCPNFEPKIVGIKCMMPYSLVGGKLVRPKLATWIEMFCVMVVVIESTI